MALTFSLVLHTQHGGINEFEYSNLEENGYFSHLSVTQINSAAILWSVD